MDATYEADVVICGGGIAGISTAIEALDRGKSVLVLDRDAEPALGGLALESAGGVFVVDTPEQRKRGIKDTPEKALTDWLDFAEFGPDDRWPRAWAEAYVGGCRAEVYDWVKGFGVEFLPVPQWPERGLYGEGNSVPRWHLAWGMGKGLTEPLVARLRNHPNAAKLTLRFGHRVEGLETRAGVVAGVHGILERGEASFAAKGQAIVIASGGIGGNLQRVKRHWHPEWGTPPEILLNGAHRYGDGRLHDAAESAGARLTHMNRMWAYVGGIHHPKPRWPDHGLSIIPCRHALWLDWQGRRIGPPPLIYGFNTRDLVTRLRRTGKSHTWMVFNRRIALKEMAISGTEYNPAIREKNKLALFKGLFFGNTWLFDEMTKTCMDFVTAPTLAELVVRMNALEGDQAVELDAVSAAVAHFDAQADAGPFQNDEQFRRIASLRNNPGDRLRVLKHARIADPAGMPFVAMRSYILTRKTLGGIQTDLSCRVLDVAGKPIPGLYAVGECAGYGGGGINGLRGLEGTFLGPCVFTGRVAGRNVA